MGKNDSESFTGSNAALVLCQFQNCPKWLYRKGYSHFSFLPAMI